MPGTDQRSLSKGPKWSFRKPKINALPVVCNTYAVGPGDRRKSTIRTVVGAGRTRLGELTQGGSLHLDDGETVSGKRFSEVPIHRTALRCFHNCCFHLHVLPADSKFSVTMFT